MLCPFCLDKFELARLRVAYTRASTSAAERGAVRRRRVCPKCKAEFRTSERFLTDDLTPKLFTGEQHGGGELPTGDAALARASA